MNSAYVLTSTIFLPVFASLADIFGRYWAMQIGILCFMVGSAISTAANSMPVLLIGRGVAGIGAAALLTVRRFSMINETTLNPVCYRSSESFWQIPPAWKKITSRLA